MRCKACDSVLQPEEVIWREVAQDYETLCRRCKSELYKADPGESDDDLIGEIVGGTV